MFRPAVSKVLAKAGHRDEKTERKTAAWDAWLDCVDSYSGWGRSHGAGVPFVEPVAECVSVR